MKSLKLVLLFGIAFPFACKETTKNDLIIGKWKMEGKELVAQMHLQFNKDKSCVIKRVENGQVKLSLNYKYDFNTSRDHLLLIPIDSTEKQWNVEIIELSRDILKLRSQSPDSSVLELHRSK